jgi:hypothetical protein
MCAELVDLVLRPLDHRLEVGDQLLIHSVVCGPKRIEGGRAGTVENPKHRKVLTCVGGHIVGRLMPRQAPP